VLGAGGSVTTLEGAPLRYNSREELLNPFFVVAGPQDHDWLALLR
jgi:3'(2'), 5'-bisphosphate nucleotidase